jgi:SAM-dependent methyltransferase
MDHRLLGYSFLRGCGIEIGALHQPARVPPGVQVAYCDAHTETEIVAHFPELASTPLVHVDHVVNLDTQALQAFGSASQDFVILNHVIEHVANPVRVLHDVVRVLRPGGVAVVSAPDKNHSFDKPRASTPWSHLWAEYQANVTDVTDDHYAEFLRAVHPETQESPERFAGALVAVRARREHAHVWTADEFAGFMRECRQALDWPVWPVLEFTATQGEYFSVWRKGGQGGAADTWAQEADTAFAAGVMPVFAQQQQRLAELAHVQTLLHTAHVEQTEQAQAHAHALQAAHGAVQASQAALQQLQSDHTGLQAHAAHVQAALQARTVEWQALTTQQALTVQHAAHVQAALDIQTAALAQSREVTAHMQASLSWRITQPLRWLRGKLG